MLPIKEQKQLNSFIDLCKSAFSVSLAGIYLHGSAAMGCFNPSFSDLDVIVVVNTTINREVLVKFTRALMAIDPNRFELSIVLKRDVEAFSFPTPYLYHYSKAHAPKYLEMPDFLIADGLDPDLAAHFRVIQARGKCLYGAPIAEVFTGAYQDFFKASILEDIAKTPKEMLKNPVYHVLNMARTLYYLECGEIASKREGGEWLYRQVDQGLALVLQWALDAYTNPCSDSIEFSSVEEPVLHLIYEFYEFFYALLKSS